MNHFLLCGSHPLLSLAEAAVLLPGPIPTVVESIALFDRSSWDGARLQKRLSGAVKIGDIMISAPLASFTATHLADLIDALPRGNKVIFGLSLFGAPKEKNQLKQLPIQLKRVLQERKRSVRWFTGDKGTVSSAAVAKLDLIQTGYDLQVIIDAGTVHVGLTTHVQDLDAWSLRDFGRPFRDATMGMLPPKLARLMVNLAGSEVEHKTLLDPFCGSGTVLMEAALVGYSKQIGSDIDARQVGGSKQNIDWLVSEHFMTTEQRQAIALHTHPVETLSTIIHEQIDVIVTEGFLGKPLNGNETFQWLDRQKQELETLWDHSFRTFAALQPRAGVVVATVPRHRVQGNEITIDADKAAAKHGYTRVNPLENWGKPLMDLTYAREDQRVERRICIWKKTK
jgi:tRNA G10  N-methylase Trm11